VCSPAGQASAVLLRAGAVSGGLETARQRRPAVRDDHDLASGPAKLMQVLALDKSANGTSVVDGTGPATLVPGERPDVIAVGPRVGVTSAFDVPWRFWVAGDPTVSVYRRHTARKR
jgi:DNA-3-methyladenine glycosylase